MEIMNEISIEIMDFRTITIIEDNASNGNDSNNTKE